MGNWIRNHKKISCLLCVLLVCVLFYGCTAGNSSDGESVSTQSTEALQATEYALNIPTEEVGSLTEEADALTEEVSEVTEETLAGIASETETIASEIDTESLESNSEDASKTDSEATAKKDSKTAFDTASSSSDQTSSSSGSSSRSSSSKSSSASLSGSKADAFDLSTVPAYTDSPYAEVNGNVPFFKESDLTTTSYESYSELDSLGRCGVAMACIGTDLMPTEERGEIGSVKPTGWHTVKYDCVSGKYLYNRCHLIAFELAGENANTKNLITGTRYFNVDGMLPFENMVHDYVVETEEHVLYRVTPIFEGNNLVASGVLMEAYSVEDHGASIEFCVYCYNVQPGIVIDYATGDSYEDGSASSSSSGSSSSSSSSDSNSSKSSSSSGSSSGSSSSKSNSSSSSSSSASSSSGSSSSKSDSEQKTYILNTSTKKFHLPSCSSVKQMSEKNTLEYTGTREEVIDMGYEACKRCNP